MQHAAAVVTGKHCTYEWVNRKQRSPDRNLDAFFANCPFVPPANNPVDGLDSQDDGPPRENEAQVIEAKSLGLKRGKNGENSGQPFKPPQRIQAERHN